MDKISRIKLMVKQESEENKKLAVGFFDWHLSSVEKFSRMMLKKFPKADKESVLLSVWLHDLQRIRNLEGDHAKMGAVEAEKVMKEFGYPNERIKKVQEIIYSHSCDKEPMPSSLEGKILASADAMSHYVKDFYLTIAVSDQRNLEDYKKWALTKLEKDYNKKIFFPFAKKMIAKRHKIIKDFLIMG